MMRCIGLLAFCSCTTLKPKDLGTELGSIRLRLSTIEQRLDAQEDEQMKLKKHLDYLNREQQQ